MLKGNNCFIQVGLVGSGQVGKFEVLWIAIAFYRPKNYSVMVSENHLL